VIRRVVCKRVDKQHICQIKICRDPEILCVCVCVCEREERHVVLLTLKSVQSRKQKHAHVSDRRKEKNPMSPILCAFSLKFAVTYVPSCPVLLITLIHHVLNATPFTCCGLAMMCTPDPQRTGPADEMRCILSTASGPASLRESHRRGQKTMTAEVFLCALKPTKCLEVHEAGV